MTQPRGKDRVRAATTGEQTDSVLAACRLLIGISVRSLAAVEGIVDVTQLRVLAVLASRGTTTLSQLAMATGLHQSTASRTCERLVRQGLVRRMDNPTDRRSLRLTLSEPGYTIVGAVAQARRDAIMPLLQHLSQQRRQTLVAALEELTAAGGEPDQAHLWSVGWATPDTTQT